MMKSHSAGLVIVLGSTATLSIGHGCAFNPFAPPDFNERPGAGKNDSTSSSSTGGSSGQGSSSGEGGTGGTVCMCADDAKECTDDVLGVCPGGDAAACHSGRYGAKCSSGGCNETGECVSCLECDAPECFARCEKVACTDDAQCAKGFCEQKTCCDKECVGPCRACDRLGTEGSCKPMPVGLQVAGCNESGRACDNTGSCGFITKAALGALCSMGSVCASGACKGETCRSQNGQPCVEDLECFSNRCDPTTKTCKACTEPGVGCPEGAACIPQNGACQVLLGQPAQTSGECSKGAVFNFLCSLEPGDSCTSHAECKSRNCSLMNTCMPLCSQKSDCIAGTSCFNGACKLLDGNYCVVDAQCESNNCSGFPRRCQP